MKIMETLDYLELGWEKLTVVITDGNKCIG